MLARRTTSLGSIIETVLFAGEPIVTEIVVPAPDGGITANTARAVAQTPADSASALPSDAAAALPPSIGSGFGGTWLSGEIIDDYLILHRIRANAPVAHDIFRQGRKVGSVTEVGPPIRAGRSAGNLFEALAAAIASRTGAVIWDDSEGAAISLEAAVKYCHEMIAAK